MEKLPSLADLAQSFDGNWDGDPADPRNSKLDDLQLSAGPYAAEPQWSNLRPGATVTMLRPHPGRYQWRSILRNLGLPISNETRITSPCQVDTMHQGPDGMQATFHCTGEPTIVPAPRPLTDWKRLGYVALSLLWIASSLSIVVQVAMSMAGHG